MARKIVVALTGGIAAYKTAELVSRLKKADCEVRVVMTKNACEFITPLTMETLSGYPVAVEMFAEHARFEVEHIALAKWAEAVIIAPATANIIGKIANGIADDFLSTFVMATKAPVVIAPAMNDGMYTNPIVTKNIAFLKEMGYIVLEPDEGHLACGTSGKGRLPEPARLADFMLNLSPQDLRGLKVLVTAGPTQEALDPVRYLTNHSSGKMGYAIAKRAAARGAEVVLVSGAVDLPVPWGATKEAITSAEEMYQAVMKHFPTQDIVIKAAAVADYRPKAYSAEKIKKHDGELVLELERTRDILAALGKEKTKQILVGFAAETENIAENAQAKLKKKNVDMIVANNLRQEGGVFGKDDNRVTIYKKSGEVIDLPKLTKDEVAEEILNQIKLLRAQI